MVMATVIAITESMADMVDTAVRIRILFCNVV